ncbi:MAG TPA: hypothetical protein VHX87_09760 [Galbitalea sp.]|jgi:hypothetical protein|nr:hypothetical protein [Galbitalea sp.]
MQSFNRVAIGTDRFASDGVPKGTIGYIIEDFPDDKMAEIEISDPLTGEATAILDVREDDLKVAPASGHPG